MKALKINELKRVNDMVSLKGKAAFITGAAGGIGRSCAAILADAGANVTLMDIPAKADVLAENCREIEARYGVETLVCTGDVRSEEDVTRMINEAADRFGRLDIVFSNAGVAGKNDNASEIALEEWQKVIDIDLTGMLLVDRVGGNKMRDFGNGGAIINTASMSGMIINKKDVNYMRSHMVAYASAKAGVIQMTKSVALCYAQDGIRCNCISPGMIYSGMHEGWDMTPLNRFIDNEVPLKRFGTLDEITGIVLFLASDMSTYATGSNFVVDGGVTCW